MSAGLGLYALKPWYAEQLAPVADRLVARRVHPDVVSLAGVGAGAAAGVALALLPPGPLAAVAVGVALAARLACANLDGTLARRQARTSTRGAVLNEVGDRVAELAALAGLWFSGPSWLVLLAALAMSTPSWVALAGAATGAPRRQGGPVGKTERAAVLVAVAATGWVSLGLVLLVVGSALTAVRRLLPLVRSPR
jgi:CDP-diacylglycerol--glycerol-3-phosphate 3-phosphatidyltransferase